VRGKGRDTSRGRAYWSAQRIRYHLEDRVIPNGGRPWCSYDIKAARPRPETRGLTRLASADDARVKI